MNAAKQEQIEQAIAEAEGRGEKWTNLSIFEVVGGHYGDMSQYLKQRRAAAREAGAAVAVAEEEAPAPEPEAAPPGAPLSQARQKRDWAAAAEHALGEEEQAVKQQRRALEEQVQQLAISAPVSRSDAADLEVRRRLRELRTALEAVEAERLEVHRRRRAAFEAKLTAQDAYEALEGQAARWLRRLRQAQRIVQTSAAAYQRGEAREALAQALEQLAELVGREAAEALAADPSLYPGWLRS
jgi:hypothetical protein